jgi:hypothetical protein
MQLFQWLITPRRLSPASGREGAGAAAAQITFPPFVKSLIGERQ